MNWQPEEKAMSEWMKIETAPKDGSIVLLRDERKVYKCAMAWNNQSNQWEGMSFSMFGSIRTKWDESFVKPYEWKPLPPPPTEEPKP